MRCDSLDQSGSADDLADSRPAASPAASRQRSSSVHTLKYAHPQRVISSRGHSGSQGETTGPEQAPGQAARASQPQADAEARPAVGPPRLSSLKVPSGESVPSDPGPKLDAADEEVSRINSSAEAHSRAQLPPGSPPKSRRPSPAEQGSRLSQSASPASGGNRKRRTSPPPGEERVAVAAPRTDSSVELRRRTLSFDATSSPPNQSEEAPADD